MNTISRWETTATIHDEERLELWGEVFPGGVVPICSIIPQKVRVPERGVQDAFMLDLTALTPVQLDGVIGVIAKRFGIPLDEVRGEIHLGVPILADGVSVVISDPGIFFSIIDDFDEGVLIERWEDPDYEDDEEDL